MIRISGAASSTKGAVRYVYPATGTWTGSDCIVRVAVIAVNGA